MQWVGDCMREVSLGQVSLEIVDVLLSTLDFAVLSFIQTPHKDVRLGSVFRELRSDFLAEESARPIGYGKTPIECVTIGEGKKIHPTLAGLVMECPGFGVARRHTDPARKPL